MTAPITLGLLDSCGGADSVLWETIELAQAADALGYHRYWLAEHHTCDAAHGAPELLVPIIAGLTSRLRVGTGGIPLHLYSPLKVAKSFLLLHCLFPDRIDLGLVRTSLSAEALAVGAAAPIPFAPADDASVLQALLDGRVVSEAPDALFARKLDELIALLTGKQVRPSSQGAPEVWVLGSGKTSGMRAAAIGGGFGLSLFHPWMEEPAVVEAYRQSFRAHAGLPAPRVLLAVAGVCAENEARAHAIASEHTNRFFTPRVVGSPAQCREQLEQLRARYGVSELLFYDVSRRHADRQRSIELLAQACRLPADADSDGRAA